MPTLYQLDSCSTCQRIRQELGVGEELRVVDIKTTPLPPAALDRMAALAGSYESLFSRRARKYRSMGLADRQLTEADYRRLILEEYTFLKRPVLLTDDAVFVGNAKKTVAAAKAALHD